MLFLDHLRLAWQASNKPIDDFCLTFTHQHVRVSDASQQCAHAAFTLLQEEAGEDVAKAWLNDLKSRDESIVATFEKGKTLQRELEPYLQTTRSNWGGKSAYDLLDSTYYPQPLSKDIIVRFADISSQITFPRASAAALHAIKERVASSFSHAERIMPRDLDHILFIAQQPPLSPTPPPLDGSLSKQDDFVNYNLRKRKPQGKPVSGMKIIKRKKYNPKKTKSDAAPPQDQDENSTPPSPEQGRRAEPPLPEDDSLLALSCISCSPSWDSDATQPKSPTLRNSPNPAPASASLPEDDATRRLPFGLDRIPEQGDDTFAVSGARSTMGDESGLTMELASPQFRLPLITKSHVAVEVTRNHENQEAAESMSELSFTSSPQAKRPNTPPSHQPSSPQFPHPDASQREQPDATQTQPTLPSIAQNVEHGVPCQDMNATSNPSSGTLDAEVRQKSVQELSDPLNATHTSSTMTSARSASSLESILKGEMLKDDVLMGVIETLDLGACYVVDPCNVTDSFTSEAPDRQKQRFQQSPITPLIIHNKQHKHWSLAVYRPRLLALHYYDSVQAPQLENAALGACMASLKWFGQDNACIRWKRMHCAQQSDCTSCGVHILANLEAILAGQPVPKTIDAGQHRLAIHTCLSRPHREHPPYGPARMDQLYPSLPSCDNRQLQLDEDRVKPHQQEALTYQRHLESQANRFRQSILETNVSLEATMQRWTSEHTRMLSADDFQIWCQETCDANDARLSALESNPPPPQPVWISSEASATSEYTEYLEQLKRRVGIDRSRLIEATRVFNEQRLVWHTARTEAHEQRRAFEEFVEDWQGYHQYAIKHRRLLTPDTVG